MVIIFDMDGTLADSFDYVSDFMARQAGIMMLDDKQKDKLRHLSMTEMARALGFKWWHAPLLYFRGRRRMQHSIKNLNAFKGIPELVKKLHGEGHQLFVLSNNSTRNVRRFLHEQKMDHYFKGLYGGTNFFGKAPALRRLFKKQNVKVEEAVYIGDEVRDVLGAKAVSLRIIAVSWGFANREHLKSMNPNKLVDTTDELRRELGKLK